MTWFKKISIHFHSGFENEIVLIPTIKVWKNDFTSIPEMNFISYGICLKFLRPCGCLIINFKNKINKQTYD